MRERAVFYKFCNADCQYWSTGPAKIGFVDNFPKYILSCRLGNNLVAEK